MFRRRLRPDGYLQFGRKDVSDPVFTASIGLIAGVDGPAIGARGSVLVDKMTVNNTFRMILPSETDLLSAPQRRYLRREIDLRQPDPGS